MSEHPIHDDIQSDVEQPEEIDTVDVDEDEEQEEQPSLEDRVTALEAAVLHAQGT